MQRVFISGLRPETASDDKPQTSLGMYIDAQVAAMLELDRVSNNNAGKNILELMIRFFTRPPPPEKYESMKDFLLYRREDAAVP